MVDPGLLGDLRCCWAAAEPFGVGGVGRVEGDLARVVDGAGGAEVNRRWGVPSDPRVAKDVVVLGEESVTEPTRVLDAGERSWEVVQVLHRLELGLGKGVVIADPGCVNCFEAIPHSGLMSAVQERVSDRRLLGLLRAFLRAGVMHEGTVRRAVTGTPQGGVVSPLLANVYLHRLDRAWRGAYGTPVRYADDLVVLCRSQGQAVAALARLTSLLADLGLQPKQAKTRIVHLTDGGEGLDFLGFHHRLVHPRLVHGTSQFTFLARWPSRKAMQHARDRIRFMTMRARLAAPVEQVVQELNLFLRGWAGYFRYGNSAQAFDKTCNYAVMRLALFLAKRHQRPSAWGFAQVYRSRDTFGLVSLNGIVAAPRPNRAWRAPVEHRR